MSDCRSCGAPIIWAKTKSGKRIPLNADPDPAGNVMLEDGIAVVLGKGAAPGPTVRRYTSHFANCGQAGLWRKP